MLDRSYEQATGGLGRLQPGDLKRLGPRRYRKAGVRFWEALGGPRRQLPGPGRSDSSPIRPWKALGGRCRPEPGPYIRYGHYSVTKIDFKAPEKDFQITMNGKVIPLLKLSITHLFIHQLQRIRYET